MPPFAFFKGDYVPLSEAKVGIMTHALNYGTAVFEGIRGNWNEEDKQIYLFRSAEHFDRLRKSCRIMNLSLEYPTEELCEMAVKLVDMCGFTEDIYVRPMVYQSSEVLGVRSHDVDNDFFMFVAPFGPYFGGDDGIRCCISSWRRPMDTMIPPRAKVTGLYVNSALAKTEAMKNGFEEAIMLTQEGHVSEGSGENLFIVSDGKLVTPATSDSVLLGITRSTVIQIASEELGIETIEKQVDRSELYASDELFLTGTAAHITPVVELDHRPIGDGKVGQITDKLRSLYVDIIKGKNEQYQHWCTPAYSKVATS
jgi:branched-chain amino acid aminotransferase